MGRRKKAQKKTIKKKRPTVPTSFKCCMCNHDDAVECDLDMKNKVGNLNCRICGANFQAEITYLTEPIDLFCEWIDQAEAAQVANS
mmetsp:Transcript_7214/g.7570  ORF Transcript_7214/g.7570 Transcript_7214/m.7570 type:complete len:86 (+) Transcript_7214:26-283(+)